MYIEILFEIQSTHKGKSSSSFSKQHDEKIVPSGRVLVLLLHYLLGYSHGPWARINYTSYTSNWP